MSRRMPSAGNRLLVAAVLTGACLVSLTPALAQSFLPQGPAPSFGPFSEIQSHDAPPNGTVGGAIQAVLPHPTDPNIMYIGGVNGGVWRTTDGGATWIPLSDRERSLSIASLAFDPTDATRQKIYAGIGITSNGSVGSNRGGQEIGILYSSNGGTSWTELAGTAPTNLLGNSIVSVAARGQLLLAAASDPHDAAAAGGLYRSTNGGTAFSLVSGTGGLASGAVSSLVGDTGNQSVFYAAVNATGVYRSANDGQDWSQVLALGTNRVARIATGANGTVVVGVYDSSPESGASPTRGRLVELKHSNDGGATWVSLAVPDINPGRQASTDFAVAVDPANPSIVYVAGDRIAAEPYTVTAFRVIRQQDGTSRVESLTDGGTSDGSTTHADARTLVFDALGRLIQGGDGGLYVRTNPQGIGVWRGMNVAGLSLREAYGIAYDSISRRLVVSAQDTGSAYQASPGSQAYNAVGGGGDGVNAAVNDKTLRSRGRSIIYTTSQNLAPLVRQVVDADGNVLDTYTFNTRQGSTNVFGIGTGDLSATPRRVPTASLPFSSRLVLNSRDPQKIAIGSHYVYTTTDTEGASQTLTLTNLGVDGTRLGNVTALAYGTADNENAVIAGVAATSAVPGSTKGFYLSTTGGAGSLQRLTAYAGDAPVSVVFDARSASRFFAADESKLWGTTTTGTSFGDLTSNLVNNAVSLNITRPTSVEFISKNGVNSLLVGGLNGSNTTPVGSPLATADSDGSGTLTNWRPFGANLPNTMVNLLDYNEEADVLVAGLFGRGAWLLYDVTTYFSTATVLKFGSADNDSAPTASLLTGARNVEKVGTGVLTITGTPTYTGATIVNGGRLAVNGNITSSSGVTVGVDGTLGGTGTVPSTTVNGALAPGNSIGTITVSGNLTFSAGSTYQVEIAGTANDRTNVTGTATLAGTTRATWSGTSFTRAPNTILSSAGGLSGTFLSLATAGLPPFLAGRLGYTSTDVTVSLSSAMASMPGLGANQTTVARVFDTAFNAGSGLGSMPGLFGVSSAQLPQAIETLSGDAASVAQSAALSAGAQFTGLMTERASARRAEELACRDAAPSVDSCQAQPEWNAWAMAFGGTGWLYADAATGSSASQQTIGGTAFGGDWRVAPGTLLGLAVGLSDSSWSMTGTGAIGRATGAHVGAYGLQSLGSSYVGGALTYSRYDGSMTRPIVGVGNTETAKSTPQGSVLAGRLEVGHSFAMRGAALTPFAAFQPAQYWQPATGETSVSAAGGPGVFALSYQAQSTTSLPLFLGGQVDAAFELAARPLRSWMRLAWIHEFAPDRPVTAGFQVLPGTAFTVDGAPAASDALRIDLGGRYALGEQTSLFATAGSTLSGRSDTFSGTVGLKFTW